jgi:hypothetical protein
VADAGVPGAGHVAHFAGYRGSSRKRNPINNIRLQTSDIRQSMKRYTWPENGTPASADTCNPEAP